MTSAFFCVQSIDFSKIKKNLKKIFAFLKFWRILLLSEGESLKARVKNVIAKE